MNHLDILFSTLTFNRLKKRPYCITVRHGLVYYVKLETPQVTAYKFGYTGKTVEERVKAIIRTTETKATILETFTAPSGIEAYNFETYLHRKLRGYVYTGSPLLRCGNSEVYSIDILSHLATREYTIPMYTKIPSKITKAIIGNWKNLATSITL